MEVNSLGEQAKSFVKRVLRAEGCRGSSEVTICTNTVNSTQECRAIHSDIYRVYLMRVDAGYTLRSGGV